MFNYLLFFVPADYCSHIKVMPGVSGKTFIVQVKCVCVCVCLCLCLCPCLCVRAKF